MSGIFIRRKSYKRKIRYSSYREEIREDFCECCAYCLLHEDMASGREAYEIDHFKPKSIFPTLVNEYSNLFYSCHVCNKIKRDHWPSDELLAKGYRFIDTSSEKFMSHFSEEEDGTWVPLTKAGEYTVEKLRLNREHLIRIRGLLITIAARGALSLDWNKPIGDQVIPILDAFEIKF